MFIYQELRTLENDILIQTRQTSVIYYTQHTTKSSSSQLVDTGARRQDPSTELCGP